MNSVFWIPPHMYILNLKLIIYFYSTPSSSPNPKSYPPVPLIIAVGRANSYRFYSYKFSRDPCQPLNDIRPNS